jgi:tRNA-dihydrouridine synthase A
MVAPMVDVTDKHYRYFLRQCSKHAVLFTEMVVDMAIIHNTTEVLAHEEDGPCILQLGGSTPHLLAQAVALAEPFGYQGYNLNVGCPSPTVLSGAFGACLMKTPLVVRDCFVAMQNATQKPVTKTRLGVDHDDTYDFLYRFIDPLVKAGCQQVIIHARKAILGKLSPKQNRTIPPLDYERVYRLKKDFPQLSIILNGGLMDVEGAHHATTSLDGAMLGRAVWRHPCLLFDVDTTWYHDVSCVPPLRHTILKRYSDYAIKEQHKGVRPSILLKPLYQLYHGQQGSTAWKKMLNTIQDVHALSSLSLSCVAP